MNCTNCGAPLALHSDRRYYLCQYCSTIHFPEENADGVRVLEEVGDLSCPACRVPLLHAWVDEIPVLYCSRCRGLLLDQSVFLIALRYLRARQAPPPAVPRPFDPAELKRGLSCPACGAPMDTHPYAGPGNIVIDNCPRCRLLWLDALELSRVVSALGRDRGDWL